MTGFGSQFEPVAVVAAAAVVAMFGGAGSDIGLMCVGGHCDWVTGLQSAMSPVPADGSSQPVAVLGPQRQRGVALVGVAHPPHPAGTLRDSNNLGEQWRKVRDELGVPGVTTHSLRETVATLIDEEGLWARICADHLGHVKVPMTQDRYMSRGRVHNEVAALLDRAIKDE